MLQRWFSSDRRRSARSMDTATNAVLLEGGDPVGQVAVQNLSAGGALLSGHVAATGKRPLRLLLEIGLRAEPIRLGANIRRQSLVAPETISLAVRFRHVTSDTEDLIQEMVLGELVRKWNSVHPAVLVIDEREKMRQRMSEDLRNSGRRVRTAEDPSSALSILDDPNEHIDTVILHEGTGSALSYQLIKSRSLGDHGIKTYVLQGYMGARRRLLQGLGLLSRQAREKSEKRQ